MRGTDYLSYGSDKLCARLAEVATELSGLQEDLARSLIDEHRTRTRAFMASEAPSVAAREREAAYESTEATCAAFELRGLIKALTEEKELLLTLLDHGFKPPFHASEG